MKPTLKERKFWGRLARTVGCIACRIDGIRNTYVSIHHIDGRTKKGAHMKVLPLCGPHHQTGDANTPCLHPWTARFEKKYGTQYELLKKCHEILAKHDAGRDSGLRTVGVVGGGLGPPAESAAGTQDQDTARTEVQPNQRRAMNIFEDQQMFMTVTGQTASPALYYDLVTEEVDEMRLAWEGFKADPSREALAELSDGIVDSIYTLAGLANTLLGPEVAQRMWNEVQASNMSKVQAIETDSGIEYTVRRREDGKILKPDSYFKPDLIGIINAAACSA